MMIVTSLRCLFIISGKAFYHQKSGRTVKALNQSEKFYDYEGKLKIPEGYEFMGGVALGERVNTPEESEQRRGTWTIID